MLCAISIKLQLLEALSDPAWHVCLKVIAALVGDLDFTKLGMVIKMATGKPARHSKFG